ncbi:MAG: carbohydrate porin [Gammaproteobacteria bacterium]|nr:carbohydrate porin [Gammaproteobacteria bacterium]
MNRYLVGVGVALALGAAAAQAETTDGERTTVGGKAFIDLTRIDQKNDGVEQGANGFGLDVKRFYLSVAHDFADIWSANLTTDFQYSNAIGSTGLYIKKAYLQAKVSDALVVRAGAADTPWVPLVDDLYGYRYVESVLLDRLKFGTSADWGVHVGGKLDDGRVGYAIAVLNGGGYRNPSRSKSMDVEARISFAPARGVLLALGAYSGRRGQDVQGGASPAQHTAQRVTALLAYTGKAFRMGGEYFTADNWNNITTAAKDSADGFSVWGSYSFSRRIAGFARIDRAKPGRDLAPRVKDAYLNAGLAYKPRKNIDLALVVKHEEAAGGAVRTSLGTGTLSGGAVADGRITEVGVWGQVAF